jgi:hypothetical protein
MSRKSLWIGFALVLVVGMIEWTGRVEVTTDVTRVEADIRERLPMGSSRADVASYLDQRGIPHSYVAESKTEMAMVREASRSWLVRGDIQILFKFDDHGKLISHSVKDVFTGP